jgi:hypothetical protein
LSSRQSRKPKDFCVIPTPIADADAIACAPKTAHDPSASVGMTQGRSAEARAMLADIYGWFTEGFDTADLKDVKALLNQLDQES